MTNSSTLDHRLETDTVEKIDALGARMAKARAQVEAVIFGQRDVIDQTLTTVLAGGHALLIGVPGLAYHIFVGAIILTMLVMHALIKKQTVRVV